MVCTHLTGTLVDTLNIDITKRLQREREREDFTDKSVTTPQQVVENKETTVFGTTEIVQLKKQEVTVLTQLELWQAQRSPCSNRGSHSSPSLRLRWHSSCCLAQVPTDPMADEKILEHCIEHSRIRLELSPGNSRITLALTLEHAWNSFPPPGTLGNTLGSLQNTLGTLPDPPRTHSRTRLELSPSNSREHSRTV